MAVVTAELGRAAIVDGLTALLAVGAAVAHLRFKVNSAGRAVAGLIDRSDVGSERSPGKAAAGAEGQFVTESWSAIDKASSMASAGLVMNISKPTSAGEGSVPAPR